MPEHHMKIQMYIDREINRIIRAKQFDAKSRFLDIILINEDATPFDLTDCRVQFNARKADGTFVMNNAVITDAKAGSFTIELTDQTLDIGNSEIYADISVFSNDATVCVTTRTFVIYVESTIRNDCATESSNEYNSVVTLFQDVWDMRETIRHINTKFGELSDDLNLGDEQAGSSALGALNRFWNYLKTQSTAHVVETVNGIAEILGDTGSSVGTSTVMGYLKQFEQRGIIKQKQYGVITPNNNGVTVTVNKPYDTAKSMILLDGHGGIYSTSTKLCIYMPYISAMTSTGFTVKTAGESFQPVSYQFFEFY